MKREYTKWLVAGCLGLVVSMATSARAQIFTSSYEGTALPQDPPSNPIWSLQSDPGSSASVSGGILTIVTAAPTQSLAYVLNGGSGTDWNPTTLGTTVELNLKVDSQLTTLGAGTFSIRTGSQTWVMAFATNKITEVVSGVSVAAVTDDAFHIYRFTENDMGGNLNLYVDNSPTPLMSWAGLASGANLLVFGDNLDEVGGQMQWDYIRWTNQGAFAPIPEPSATALAALGGLGMIGFLRMKRRTVN